MKRSTAWALLAIMVLAVVVRLLPLTWALYWGADMGEYHTITRQLTESGQVPTTYAGWGNTYPLFPGLFFLAGSLSLTGPDPALTLSVLTPVLAAFSALGAFLITVHIFREDRIALVAAALVAVLMPHVYTTSHPMPGAVADPIFVFALLALVKGQTDRRWLGVYLLLALALITTHHLTTYFLLIASAAYLLLSVLVRRRPSVRDVTVSTSVVAAVTVITLAYWTLYAGAFHERILPSVEAVPWWVLVGAFVAALATIPVLAVVRPKWSAVYRPRWPPARRSGAMFALTMGTMLAILSYSILVAVPGTRITLSPWLLPLFLPLLGLIALTPAGRKFCDFHSGGLAPSAWTLVIVVSMAFGLAAASRVLIPYRHFQYLMVPIALISAVGAVRLVELGMHTPRRKTLAVGLVALALAAAIPSAYPPAELMGGFNEGANPRSLSAIQWSSERTEGLVLSDHIHSSLLFGFGGVNATWDRATAALLAPDFADARDLLAEVPAPSGTRPVKYAMVTDGMEEGAMLTPWEAAAPMTPEALAKFEALPFQRLYDDGYGRVYILHWTLA